MTNRISWSNSQLHFSVLVSITQDELEKIELFSAISMQLLISMLGLDQRDFLLSIKEERVMRRVEDLRHWKSSLSESPAGERNS